PWARSLRRPRLRGAASAAGASPSTRPNRRRTPCASSCRSKHCRRSTWTRSGSPSCSCCSVSRRLPPPCAESSAPSLPDPPPPRRSLGPAGMPRPLERERDRGIRNGGVNVDARAPRMLDPPLGEQDQRGSIEPPRRVVEERKEHRRSEAMERRQGAIAVHLLGWYVARAIERQRGRVTGSEQPSLGEEHERVEIADERPPAIGLQEVDRLIVVDAIPRLEAQVGVCEMGLMTH